MCSIPSIISEGLRQYRCLLPPLQDIPKPSHPTVVNEKWHPLDKCIFVPTSVADSMECGGLKLFRNVSAVFRDKSFCNYSFGIVHLHILDLQLLYIVILQVNALVSPFPH